MRKFPFHKFSNFLASSKSKDMWMGMWRMATFIRHNCGEQLDIAALGRHELQIREGVIKLFDGSSL